MDELFFIPSAPIAMPRAYWLGFDKLQLSAQILVIQPSKFEYGRIVQAIAAAKPTDYDMDILNNLYKNSALILPHRRYGMITSTLYEGDHSDYLGNKEEKWDVDVAIDEAKLIHFSDWPVPKVRLSLKSPYYHRTRAASKSDKIKPCSGRTLTNHSAERNIDSSRW